MYRSWMKNQGIPDHEFQGKPVIGICNTWSELTPCNAHFRKIAEHVKRGIIEAGGFPVEFPVFSNGESNLRPTAMLTRNLASMDVEESIRGNPLDAGHSDRVAIDIDGLAGGAGQQGREACGNVGGIARRDDGEEDVGLREGLERRVAHAGGFCPGTACGAAALETGHDLDPVLDEAAGNARAHGALSEDGNDRHGELPTKVR
eukprot:gene39566-biopygen22691